MRLSNIDTLIGSGQKKKKKKKRKKVIDGKEKIKIDG